MKKVILALFVLIALLSVLLFALVQVVPDHHYGVYRSTSGNVTVVTGYKAMLMFPGADGLMIIPFEMQVASYNFSKKFFGGDLIARYRIDVAYQIEKKDAIRLYQAMQPSKDPMGKIDALIKLHCQKGLDLATDSDEFNPELLCIDSHNSTEKLENQLSEFAKPRLAEYGITVNGVSVDFLSAESILPEREYIRDLKMRSLVF